MILRNPKMEDEIDRPFKDGESFSPFDQKPQRKKERTFSAFNGDESCIHRGNEVKEFLIVGQNFIQ